MVSGAKLRLCLMLAVRSLEPNKKMAPNKEPALVASKGIVKFEKGHALKGPSIRLQGIHPNISTIRIKLKRFILQIWIL